MHAQLAAELHEFSGSLSRPSAGQRSKDFSQGMISFCQSLFSTPAFASLGLALEMSSLQHQDLGSCCPTAKPEGRFHPHRAGERGCICCKAVERNGGLNPGQSQNSSLRQGALSSCVQTPDGRHSLCCPDGLIFIPFHVSCWNYSSETFSQPCLHCTG